MTTRFHVWGTKDDGSPYYKGSYATRPSALSVARKYSKRYKREYRVSEGPDTLTPKHDECRTIALYARGALITAALALVTLLPVTTHAMEPPVWQQPVYPDLAACTVSYHVDDGTGLAECPDGTRYIMDRDGQRWVNEAGYPLRAPNNWYVLPDAP